jgi:protein phosphatase
MQRSHNEDRFGMFPEVGLMVVADGMGGAAAGEVAAKMAVELVCEVFVDADVTWPRGATAHRSSGLPLLVAAIERANHCVHGAMLRTPDWTGMGTTIAAVLACGDRAVLAHVGDSRIYRLRGRRLDLLSEDHSLFNEFVRAGLADPERPEDFEQRNVITRAVGVEPTVEVDARLVEVAPGDTLLLCTDGLSGVLEHRELASILLAHTNLDEAVEHLIARANDHGGPDNITALLVRWESMNAAPRGTPVSVAA